MRGLHFWIAYDAAQLSVSSLGRKEALMYTTSPLRRGKSIKARNRGSLSTFTVSRRCVVYMISWLVSILYFSLVARRVYTITTLVIVGSSTSSPIHTLKPLHSLCDGSSGPYRITSRTRKKLIQWVTPNTPYKYMRITYAASLHRRGKSIKA